MWVALAFPFLCVLAGTADQTLQKRHAFLAMMDHILLNCEPEEILPSFFLGIETVTGEMINW